MSDKRKHDGARRENDAAATKTGSGEQHQGIAGSEAPGQPDMNQNPLAGAMDQGSVQTDTIEHAVEYEQGRPAVRIADGGAVLPHDTSLRQLLSKSAATNRPRANATDSSHGCRTICFRRHR